MSPDLVVAKEQCDKAAQYFLDALEVMRMKGYVYSATVDKYKVVSSQVESKKDAK